MIEVTTTILIRRTAPEVFDYLSDFAKNPDWQAGMVSCRWTSDPPLGIGSTYDQEAKFLGRTILSSFEVIAYESGRMVKATTTSGTFPITFTRIVEPVDESSRVQAIIEGDASGIFKLAEPLMKRMVQQSIEGDYRRLKVLLER